MGQILTMIENSQTINIEKIKKVTESYGIQKRALGKFAVVGKIKPEIDEIGSIMSERDTLRDKERDLNNQWRQY